MQTPTSVVKFKKRTQTSSPTETSQRTRLKRLKSKPYDNQVIDVPSEEEEEDTVTTTQIEYSSSRVLIRQNVSSSHIRFHSPTSTDSDQPRPNSSATDSIDFLASRDCAPGPVRTFSDTQYNSSNASSPMDFRISEPVGVDFVNTSNEMPLPNNTFDIKTWMTDLETLLQRLHNPTDPVEERILVGNDALDVLRNVYSAIVPNLLPADFCQTTADLVNSFEGIVSNFSFKACLADGSFPTVVKHRKNGFLIEDFIPPTVHEISDDNISASDSDSNGDESVVPVSEESSSTSASDLFVSAIASASPQLPSEAMAYDILKQLSAHQSISSQLKGALVNGGSSPAAIAKNLSCIASLQSHIKKGSYFLRVATNINWYLYGYYESEMSKHLIAEEIDGFIGFSAASEAFVLSNKSSKILKIEMDKLEIANQVANPAVIPTSKSFRLRARKVFQLIQLIGDAYLFQTDIFNYGNVDLIPREECVRKVLKRKQLSEISYVNYNILDILRVELNIPLSNQSQITEIR